MSSFEGKSIHWCWCWCWFNSIRDALLKSWVKSFTALWEENIKDFFLQWNSDSSFYSFNYQASYIFIYLSIYHYCLTWQVVGDRSTAIYIFLSLSISTAYLRAHSIYLCAFIDYTDIRVLSLTGHFNTSRPGKRVGWRLVSGVSTFFWAPILSAYYTCVYTDYTSDRPRYTVQQIILRKSLRMSSRQEILHLLFAQVSPA